MKTTFFAFVLSLVLFSACSSSDDGDSMACEKATADFQTAMAAFNAGVNAHPGPSATKAVMDAYTADMKKLSDARDAAAKIRTTACK